MSAEMERVLETIVRIVGVIMIGLPILLFGRRLFWLLGGLAMAILCLTVATVVIAFSVYAKYPSLLEALGQVIQNPEVNRELPAALTELGNEANTTFVRLFEQLGALVLIVTLIGGIVGALILIRFPKVASGVVGLVSGPYFAFLFFDLYSVSLPGWLSGLVALATGILFAVIAWRNPDTSLIVFSTSIGANLIITGLQFDLNTSLSAIIWIGMMLLGIIYQTSALHRRQTKARQALAKQ